MRVLFWPPRPLRTAPCSFRGGHPNRRPTSRERRLGCSTPHSLPSHDHFAEERAHGTTGSTLVTTAPFAPTRAAVKHSSSTYLYYFLDLVATKATAMSLFYSPWRRADVVQQPSSQPHPSSSEVPILPPHPRPLSRSHRHAGLQSQQPQPPIDSDEAGDDEIPLASTSALDSHRLARGITTTPPSVSSSSLSPLRQTRFYHRGRSIPIHSPNEEEEDHTSTSSPHFPSFAAHASLPSSATDKNSALARALDIQRGTTDFEGKEAIDSSLRERSDIAQKIKEARVGDAGNAGEGDDDDEPEESAVSGAYLISYFVAGGAAGAASRTVVSPLERLKSEYAGLAIASE
jgi:hypothetical protein